MKSLTLKKEEAAPRPENAYTWYLYQGKPFLVRSVTGRRNIMLGKGVRFGMRASHDGKKTRLITKMDGPTIVFTLDAHTIQKLMKESKLVKKATAGVEVAFQIPDWFKDMTKEAQDKYLEEHPNSKLAKTIKSKQNKESKQADSAKSPTNFKGPANKKTAMGDDPRKERKIVSMMDKLAKMAADAKAKGEAAPNYDLCKVSIPGTNLFCKGNKGIPRKDMPQLKGKPVEGSWADKNLEKDKDGEVSGEDAFKAFLKQSNVKLDPKKIDVAKLKATQTELVGAKVSGMLQALKKDPKHPGITAPIFVSKDGYILDGHHRWAAMVGLNMADGKTDPVEMDIIEVDMGIEDLVKETNDFASKIGVAQKAAKTTKEAANLDDYKGCCGDEEVAAPNKDKAVGPFTLSILTKSSDKLNPDVERLANSITKVKGERTGNHSAYGHSLEYRFADGRKAVDAANAIASGIKSWNSRVAPDAKIKTRDHTIHVFDRAGRLVHGINSSTKPDVTLETAAESVEWNESRGPAEVKKSEDILKELQDWFNSDSGYQGFLQKKYGKSGKPLPKYAKEMEAYYRRQVEDLLPKANELTEKFNVVKRKVDAAHKKQDAKALETLAKQLEKSNADSDVLKLRKDLATAVRKTIKKFLPFLQRAEANVSYVFHFPKVIRKEIEDMGMTDKQKETRAKRSAAMRQRWG